MRRTYEVIPNPDNIIIMLASISFLPALALQEVKQWMALQLNYSSIIVGQQEVLLWLKRESTEMPGDEAAVSRTSNDRWMLSWFGQRMNAGKFFKLFLTCTTPTLAKFLVSTNSNVQSISAGTDPFLGGKCCPESGPQAFFVLKAKQISVGCSTTKIFMEDKITWLHL